MKTSSVNQNIQKVSVKAREGVPKGVWTKCPETGGSMVFAKELKKNLMVVPSSGYHFPLAALIVLNRCWIKIPLSSMTRIFAQWTR